MNIMIDFERIFNKTRGFLSIFKLLFKKTLKVPSNYSLVFSDNFKYFDKSKWRYGYIWGILHPNYPYQYCDDSINSVNCNNGVLNLQISRNPKDFIIDDTIYHSKYSVGLITSKIDFQYGWFEASIKLPIANDLWNAFWLGGTITWPPEIDIFEAYSKSSKLYDIKQFGKTISNCAIQPNLHFGNLSNNTKSQYFPYNVRVDGATDRFVRYICHWEPDFIKIYYDDILIFECTDPDILQYYNRSTDKMQVILGNGIYPNYKEPIIEDQPFQVQYVKVYQKIHP